MDNYCVHLLQDIDTIVSLNLNITLSFYFPDDHSSIGDIFKIMNPTSLLHR